MQLELSTAKRLSTGQRSMFLKRNPAIFPEPWACDWGQDNYGLWIAFNYKGIRQGLRWIPPGEFMMGSTVSEPERNEDETQHRVVLTQGFWLGETACTQALWQAVMGDTPGRIKGDDRPVASVSWQDCQAFIAKLNADVAGLDLLLPTEAQWEYACRAGTTTPFHFGDAISTDLANFNGNFPYNNGPSGENRAQTVPVKTFPCNVWGLYEMHGNVWEWCADRHGPYPQKTVVDPGGPEEGEARVLRGGSWFGYGRFLRSAVRAKGGPAVRFDVNGLRLACGRTTHRRDAAEP